MKTDDLIRALTSDNRIRLSMDVTLGIALVAGLALSFVLFLSTLAVRPDLSSALADPRVVLKFSVALTLALPATFIATRLTRPSATIGRAGLALMFSPLLLLLGIVFEFWMTPATQWQALLLGSNALYCLALVPFLSIPFLAVGLIALKHGAPIKPWLSGGAIGAASGGFGAAIYALHCPDDSPFFLAAWYGLAIAMVMTTGALIARRILAW